MEGTKGVVMGHTDDSTQITVHVVHYQIYFMEVFVWYLDHIIQRNNVLMIKKFQRFDLT